MAQSPSMAGFSPQSFHGFLQNPDESVPLKQRKIINVLVLKSSDCRTKDDVLLLPSQMEMAGLKKAEKGRFKKMQTSSKMSEADIEKSLKQLFPCLNNER